MEYVIPVAAALGALTALAVWFRARTASDGGDLPAPSWEHTDFDPPPKPHHDRTPDAVDHTLLLETWTYRVVYRWRNDDPYAESDTSLVTEEFEVRRADSRNWQIRMTKRNWAPRLEEQPWQPAPTAFLGEWEAAYSRLPESHAALL